MTSPPSILSDSDSQDADGGGTNSSPKTLTNIRDPKVGSPIETGSSKTGMFQGLRKALKEEAQSPDSIIRATAESARAQTGADGVAIALRARGAVICRARSGDLAPEIGSQLNVQSGISGECLRTASILLCQDSDADPRVDPDVCRMMGIRSIVAVPLRGAIGIAGILEAFSARPNAFGDEEINWLRELAMVAESAYEKERLALEQQTMAAMGSSRLLPALFSRTATPKQPQAEIAAVTEQPVSTQGDARAESFPPRKYWVLGVSGLALLLVLGIWLSWREPDLAEGASAAKLKNTVHASAPTADVPIASEPSDPKTVHLASKPGAALDVLKKASGVERTNDDAPIRSITPVSGNRTEDGDPSAKTQNTTGSAGGASTDRPGSATPTQIAANEPAPSVMISTDDHSQLTPLTSVAASMPAMDVRVSEGVTQAALIHKVDPTYPMQARSLRIAGTVVLEITIAEDGTIHNVKKVSGESILVAAATQAVRQWRYSPVLLNGKPVVAQRQVSVVFKLP